MNFSLILLLFTVIFSKTNGLDKEQLSEKASQLEKDLDNAVQKLKDSHPEEAKILKDERVELGLIVLNMEWADPVQLANLEKKLNTLISKVEEQLTLIEQGKSITGIPVNPTTERPTQSTKISEITTSSLLTTSGISKTTSGQHSLNCEANTDFFDNLFVRLNRINAKINELTQQHKGSEALVLNDKVHQILEWEEQLETLVGQVNFLVQQIDKLEKSVNL